MTHKNVQKKEHKNTRKREFRTLYLDCFAGLSGNMMIGALLDLAQRLEVDDLFSKLGQMIASMGLNKELLQLKESKKCGIRATYFNVEAEAGHPHRGLSDVLKIIESGDLDGVTKRRAKHCFEILAEAEAYVHGCSVEEIHFHEVGAIDAIIDITGACFLLEELKIKKVYASKVRTGFGLVGCAHGQMPIPAPATAKMLENIPYYLGETKGEFLTPTGAALLLAFEADFTPRPQVMWDTIGHGAGSRDAEFPNIVRVFLSKHSVVQQNLQKLQIANSGFGDDVQQMRETCVNLAKKHANKDLQVEKVIILETYIDDMTAEALAFLELQCRKTGALDVYATSSLGKKGRFGQQLEIILNQDLEEEILALLLTFSHTLGIRRRSEWRYVLKRHFESIETNFGTISGKVVGDCFFPEYEDCTVLALKHKKTIAEIISVAKVCFSQK